MLTFVAFNKQAFFNYYYFTIVTAWWAAAASPVPRGALTHREWQSVGGTSHA